VCERFCVGTKTNGGDNPCETNAPRKVAIVVTKAGDHERKPEDARNEHNTRDNQVALDRTTSSPEFAQCHRNKRRGNEQENESAEERTHNHTEKTTDKRGKVLSIVGHRPSDQRADRSDKNQRGELEQVALGMKLQSFRIGNRIPRAVRR
jgi:hypothetical protein